jgi:hypothetical protein
MSTYKLSYIVENELNRLFRSNLFQSDTNQQLSDPTDRLTFNYVKSRPLTLANNDRPKIEDPFHALKSMGQNMACEGERGMKKKRFGGIGAWNSNAANIKTKFRSNSNQKTTVTCIPALETPKSAPKRISLNDVRMLRSPLANDTLPPLQRFLFVMSRPEAMSGVVG